MQKKNYVSLVVKPNLKIKIAKPVWRESRNMTAVTLVFPLSVATDSVLVACQPKLVEWFVSGISK